MIATGFEPAKRIADDLKSPSFDQTWIHYLKLLISILYNGALPIELQTLGVW